MWAEPRGDRTRSPIILSGLIRTGSWPRSHPLSKAVRPKASASDNPTITRSHNQHIQLAAPGINVDPSHCLLKNWQVDNKKLDFLYNHIVICFRGVNLFFSLQTEWTYDKYPSALSISESVGKNLLMDYQYPKPPVCWLVRCTPDSHRTGGRDRLHSGNGRRSPCRYGRYSRTHQRVSCSTATTSSRQRLCLLLTRLGCTFTPFGRPPTWKNGSTTGGPYQMIIFPFFLIAIYAYMGRQWELSYRLGMRPWIAVAYSAPVAAANLCTLGLPDWPG